MKKKIVKKIALFFLIGIWATNVALTDEHGAMYTGMGQGAWFDFNNITNGTYGMNRGLHQQLMMRKLVDAQAYATYQKAKKQRIENFIRRQQGKLDIKKMVEFTKKEIILAKAERQKYLTLLRANRLTREHEVSQAILLSKMLYLKVKDDWDNFNRILRDNNFKRVMSAPYKVMRYCADNLLHRSWAVSGDAIEAFKMAMNKINVFPKCAVNKDHNFDEKSLAEIRYNIGVKPSWDDKLGKYITPLLLYSPEVDLLIPNVLDEEIREKIEDKIQDIKMAIDDFYWYAPGEFEKRKAAAIDARTAVKEILKYLEEYDPRLTKRSSDKSLLKENLKKLRKEIKVKTKTRKKHYVKYAQLDPEEDADEQNELEGKIRNLNDELKELREKLRNAPFAARNIKKYLQDFKSELYYIKKTTQKSCYEYESIGKGGWRHWINWAQKSRNKKIRVYAGQKLLACYRLRYQPRILKCEDPNTLASDIRMALCPSRELLMRKIEHGSAMSTNTHCIDPSDSSIKRVSSHAFNLICIVHRNMESCITDPRRRQMKDAFERGAYSVFASDQKQYKELIRKLDPLRSTERLQELPDKARQEFFRQKEKKEKESRTRNKK